MSDEPGGEAVGLALTGAEREALQHAVDEEMEVAYWSTKGGDSDAVIAAVEAILTTRQAALADERDALAGRLAACEALVDEWDHAAADYGEGASRSAWATCARRLRAVLDAGKDGGQ